MCQGLMRGPTASISCMTLPRGPSTDHRRSRSGGASAASTWAEILGRWASTCLPRRAPCPPRLRRLSRRATSPAPVPLGPRRARQQRGPLPWRRWAPAAGRRPAAGHLSATAAGCC
eukprot:4263358-Pyramimonas_sp.AAC.1